MIFPSFQILGKLMLLSEWLKMLVRDLMACGPMCFRCRYDIPSRPVNREFFSGFHGLSCHVGSEQEGVFVKGDFVQSVQSLPVHTSFEKSAVVGVVFVEYFRLLLICGDMVLFL